MTLQVVASRYLVTSTRLASAGGSDGGSKVARPSGSFGDGIVIIAAMIRCAFQRRKDRLAYLVEVYGHGTTVEVWYVEV